MLPLPTQPLASMDRAIDKMSAPLIEPYPDTAVPDNPFGFDPTKGEDYSVTDTVIDSKRATRRTESHERGHQDMQEGHTSGPSRSGL